jgi:hypothetical protein
MGKRILLTIFAPVLLIALSAWIGCAASGGTSKTPEENEQVAVITTEKGKIVIALYPDAAPVAVDNFR